MSTPQKILIYRLGSLGDTLVALPCFHLIRNAFPSAEITVLTNVSIGSKAAPLMSILENTGLVDHLLEYPVHLRRLKDFLGLRQKIQEQNFDLVIHLAAPRGLRNSIRDYVFFRWCGIKKIVGVPFRHADVNLLQLENDLFEPEAVRLVRRVEPLGKINPAEEKWWDLRLTENEKKEADELLKQAGIHQPFIVVGLGTKKTVNDWEEANWKSLLERISASYRGLSIVAIGADVEREMIDQRLQSATGPVVNLGGKTSPRISAAILQRAALFIGHDSGPMHLAATVGTPCVAIFSDQGVLGQWFPRGDRNRILFSKTPCNSDGLDECHEFKRKNILAITVDDVFAAAKPYLDSIKFP